MKSNIVCVILSDTDESMQLQHMLREKKCGPMNTITGEQVIETILSAVRAGKLVVDLPVDDMCEAIYIDNLDGIEGQYGLSRELYFALIRSHYTRCGKQRVIICSFYNETPAKIFSQEHEFKLLKFEDVKKGDALQ